MRRKLLVAAMVGAVAVATVFVQPASAAGATVAVFSAKATLGAELYAPFTPFCPKDPTSPGGLLCVSPTTTFAFDTATTLLPTPPGPNLCVALHVGTTPAPHSGAGFCRLAAAGVVHEVLEPPLPTIPTLGPWCGMSAGHGTLTAASLTYLTGGFEADMRHGETINLFWPLSAGTVLPLVFTDGTVHPVGPPNDTVGVGAVQTTGPNPGPCGATNASGAREFQVTGWALITAVTP